MERIDSNALGILQGSSVLFSDFEDGGPMWTGTGPRVFRKQVTFSEYFKLVPAVHIHLSMWDMDQKTNQRADIKAENVTNKGFEIVFKTWGDTRVARVRASWIALGAVRSPDIWQL